MGLMNCHGMMGNQVNYTQNFFSLSTVLQFSCGIVEVECFGSFVLSAAILDVSNLLDPDDLTKN